MVSRAYPVPAPQNPTPWRACWGRLVGDSGYQGGSQSWGTPRVEWHQKPLAKAGSNQGGVQDGIGRSGAGRVGANPILNISHPHHSPPLGATNGPILLKDNSQIPETPYAVPMLQGGCGEQAPGSREKRLDAIRERL